MKDYADDVLKIVLSCVSLENTELNGQRHIPQLIEWSEVAREINAFINKEIFALESEVISLTEQLLECDSILAARRGRLPHKISRTGQKTRKSRMMNI